MVTGSRVLKIKPVKKLIKLIYALRKRGYYIITGCGDGIEQVLISQSDGQKFKRLIVVLPVNSSGYMTVWGKNIFTSWGQPEVDSVMVARSEICFFIGRPDERIKKMITFAENTDKKVKKLR